MNNRYAELNAIRQVIDLYIDGCHTGNIALLRAAFHPQAMMYGAGGEQTIIAGIDGLYAYIEANEPPVKTGEPHQCFITDIRYDGPAATVEMVQEAAYGNDYINYFQLLKIEGKWQIVSKSYSATPVKKEQVQKEALEMQVS